jgi:hypothetical protein
MAYSSDLRERVVEAVDEEATRLEAGGTLWRQREFSGACGGSGFLDSRIS